MHQYTGTLKVKNLDYLEQGLLMTLVLTGVVDVPVLEFKHAEDATWRKYPGFSGAITDGVIVEDFRCISGYMRLNFASQPADPYYLSVVPEAIPQF